MEGNEPQNTNQPEGNQGEGNNQNPNQEFTLAGWTAGATAEQKEKYGSRMAEYDKMPSFLDAAFTAMDKLERAVIRPGEDASEEEVAAYRELMKLPADSNGYELTAEEGSGAAAFIENMKQFAFDNEIPSDKAQAMVDFYLKTEKEAMEAVQTELKNTIETGMKELQKEMGSQFEPKMLQARRMVKAHFGEDFSTYLEDSQLGNDPRFIRGMMALSDKVSEDNLDLPAGGGNGNGGGWSFPNTPGME